MPRENEGRNSQEPSYKMFRRRKQIPLYEMTKDEARRFCTETAIHGFQYIARPDNTPAERFIWTFLSFGALFTALILSTLSWVYSNETPTLIAADSMQDPIFNFYYPGISICSFNKISKKKTIIFLNETLLVDNHTYWLNKIDLLVQMYFSNYDTVDSTTYSEVQRLLDINGITAEDALTAITPSCKDMMVNCMWKGRKIRCDRLFQATRTAEGTCCSFNHFAFRNRTFSGYMADRYKPYARKVVACGHMSGMKVLLKHDPEDYVASDLSAYGAKLLMHDPYGYPDWSAQRVLLPMGRQIYADINPSKTYATDDLKSLSIPKRKCIFKTEQQLKIFSNYSYLNCLTECRIGIIINICGCMPYYYRNEWWDWTPKIRTCSLRDVSCLAANKLRFMSSVPGYDIYQTRKATHKWGKEKSECKCELDCETRTYTIQSTMGKLSIRQLSTNRQFFGALSSVKNYTLVSVFFKDLTGIRNKRDVSYTWVSIFGLFGGLLGLCLGFSFIAIVDVLYTFTLRLGINVMRRKQEMNQVKQAPLKTEGFNVLPLIDEPVKLHKFKYTDKNIKYPGHDIWFIN